MRRFLFAVTLALGCCSPAMATGNELLGDCIRAERVMDERGTTPQDVAAGMRCMGVVKGAQDMVTLAGSIDPKSTIAACPPNDGTIGQSVRVTLKFLHGHPDMLNLPDGWLVGLALREAFPCPVK